MRIRQTIGLGAALALAAAFTGCNTNQSGVKNEFGTITAMLDAEPPEVAAAAAKAMQQLELTTITHTATALDGLVIARTARDEKVRVDIKDAGDQSEVKIRLGTFGDAARSQTVLERIRANLANPVE